MKKTLALILAILMVSSCLVISTAAATTTGEIIIPISDCGSRLGFSSSTEPDTYGQPTAEADGTLAFTFDGVLPGPVSGSSGYIIYMYNSPNGTMDASAMQTLVFDLYVSNAAALQNTSFEFELRGVGGNDGNELHKVATLAGIGGTQLKDGWNHIEIKIADLTKVGTVDMSKWNYFRFYATNAHGVEGETTVVKLDNVYMTSREIPKVTIPTQGDMTVQPGKGHGQFTIQQVFETPIDISAMTMLEFDVTMADVAQQQNWRIDIELTSSGTYDQQETGKANVSFAELAAYSGVELVNGVNHIMIPMSKLGGSCDKTRFNYFRIFNRGDANITAAAQLTINNIVLTTNEIEPKLNYEGGPAVVHANELTIVNKSDVTSAGGGTGFAVGCSFEAQMFAQIEAIEFEVYIDNEALLSTVVCFELTSSGTCDNEENFANATIESLFVRKDGEKLKLNEWNAVRVDFSKFTGVSRGGLNHPEANYMRIFNNGAMSTTGSTVMKLKNITLIGAQVEEPDNSEPAAPIPGVDNLNRFDDGATVPTDRDSANKALTFINLAEGGFQSAGTATATTFTAMDVSDAEFLFMDLYLENYTDFAATPFSFEITSSGQCDVEESCLSGTLSEMFFRVDGGQLTEGWNQVYVPLTSPKWAQSKGGADWSRINFARIFNNAAISASAKTVAAIDNLCFTDFATWENMQDVLNATSVSIQSASMQLKETLNVIFYADVHESMTGATMTVSYMGQTLSIPGVRTGKLNQMSFTLENVLPQCMTEEISASLVAFTYDGKMMSDSVGGYSVKKYCTNMLDSIANGTVADEGGELEALLLSVLNYGAAAQVVANYKTDALATDGVANLPDPKDHSTAPQYEGLVGDKGTSTVELLGATGALGDTYKLRFYISATDPDNMGLTYKTSKGVELAVTKDMLTTDGSDTYFEVTVRPYELNLAHLLTVEGNDSYMLTYSFGTYLNNIYDACDANTQTLIDTIYSYSEAAMDYVVSLN